MPLTDGTAGIVGLARLMAICHQIVMAPQASHEAVRDVMVAHGDSAKPMWLTELGWSTYTGTYGVSEAKQAQYLTDSFTWLSSRPYVTNAFWYAFRNTYWLNDDPNSWEANVGLLRTDYTAKPALTALTELATTPTDIEPVATTTMTVSTLTGTSARSGKGWVARASTTVVDQSGVAMPGVIVEGGWTVGGAGACTTGVDGRCTLSSTRLNKSLSSTTYQITGLTKEGATPSTAPLPVVTVQRP